MEPDKIGAKISKLRKQKGLTCCELAKEMSVSHTAVNKWESGTSLPRAKKLPRLAKLLGCSVSDFF